MATPANRLIRDQNLNIHSTGALGGKVDPTRAAKKGALGGRRALNDISNAKNIGAVGKDLGASKLNSFGNPEKGKASGRKALGDLTNTVKPSLQNVSGKNQGKKIRAIAEKNVPISFKDEGFLHNHEECLKAQRNTMNYDYFLETIGLTNGSSLVLHQSGKLKKPKSPVKYLEEMEDMPMALSEDEGDDDMKLMKWQPVVPDSPIWEPLNENYWKDDDFLDFKLIESPKMKKV